MKKCKKCGTELRDGAEFCSECGAKVRAKKWIPWTIGGVVVVLLGGGIWFFAQNDDAKDTTKGEPKQETVASKEKESLEKKLIENHKLLGAAVYWYAHEIEKIPSWDLWQLNKDEIATWKMEDNCQNTEQGDGYYYAYELKDRNNAPGYVLSEDKEMIYLYTRCSIAEKVKPVATITIADLAKKIEEEGKTSEIEKQAKEIKVSGENKEEKKDKESSPSNFSKEQKTLSSYIQKWQEAMGQKYEENSVTPNKNDIIEMKDVIITNHLDGKEDVLLSIEGKFVDVSVDKASKQGYQVIAAYSGISENAKNYRYLFVLHDNKPEVLVATLPAAIGETKKGPAINFVPTKNEALPSAFAEIVKTGKAPEAPKKAKNVVNSLEDAKAIYREIFGKDAIEGPVPNNEAHSGRWEEKPNGNYYYYCGDDYAGDYMALTVHPDGSVDYRNFCHSIIDISSSCTYKDVEDGTAKDKLMQELAHE